MWGWFGKAMWALLIIPGWGPLACVQSPNAAKQVRAWAEKPSVRTEVDESHDAFGQLMFSPCFFGPTCTKFLSIGLMVTIRVSRRISLRTPGC